MTEPTGNEIVPNLTLSEAVALYREACTDIAEAFGAIARAEQKLEAFGEYVSVASVNGHRCPSFDHPARTLADIEKKVWAGIVNRMGIRGVMSIKARDELDKQLEKGDMPPLTEETVLGMMRGMQEQLPSLAEDAIREVWEWLRPREDTGWAREYKSNPRFELQTCVKISLGLDRWPSRLFSVGSYTETRLDALERVFRVLDGKGAAQKGHRSDIVQGINATPQGSGAECSTAYFRAKLFKKGSIHIYFRRADLVAEFNRVCGGMNLRGERAA
jgi:hypothetical protein